MEDLNQDFKELIQTLYLIQNKNYDNKYKEESALRFKQLCESKKFYFFGVGYYAKSLPKYIKKKYNVVVDGQYDFFSNRNDKINTSAFKLANMYYEPDETKKNKINKNIPLLSEEEFYSDPENTVVFLNYDNPIVEPYFLYALGFKNLYYLQNLAGDIIDHFTPPKKFDIYDRLDTMRTDYCFSDMDISTIANVYDSLNDQKSKQVFINLLKVKITSDVSYSQEVFEPTKPHYFDNSVIKLHKEEVFVDCGANIGDTIESFLKFNDGKFKHIYAYEPDEINYNKMINYIDTLESKNKITPFMCGVGHKTETVNIINPGSTTTAITSTDTGYKIEVKTIEDTVEEIPTLIKMDVEGYEICALNGAKNIIIKHKPKLAISIYHKFDDLWNIPALIKMWVPEYKISIRQYAFDRTETVLYATID